MYMCQWNMNETNMYNIVLIIHRVFEYKFKDTGLVLTWIYLFNLCLADRYGVLPLF